MWSLNTCGLIEIKKKEDWSSTGLSSSIFNQCRRLTWVFVQAQLTLSTISQSHPSITQPARLHLVDLLNYLSWANETPSCGECPLWSGDNGPVASWFRRIIDLAGVRSDHQIGSFISSCLTSVIGIITTAVHSFKSQEFQSQWFSLLETEINSGGFFLTVKGYCKKYRAVFLLSVGLGGYPHTLWNLTHPLLHTGRLHIKQQDAWWNIAKERSSCGRTKKK